MKTKALFLSVAVLFFVSTAFALETEKPGMNISETDAGSALVSFSSPQPTFYEFSIVNGKNEMLYYRKSETRQKAFNNVFDFSDFGKGTYYVCMNYGNKSLNCKVKVTNNGVESGKIEQCYEPYFKLENEKLDFSFLNISQKPVYVNVYKNKRHVSGTKLGNSLSIQKSLDFSYLESGEYQVVVTDHFKDRVYNFSK